MSRYRLLAKAVIDLDEIWMTCARESGLEAAERLITTITDCFVMLAGMPDAGRRREDIAHGVRSFPSGSYLIYYRKTARERIYIIRVIHGRRDQRKAWGDGRTAHAHRKRA